MLIKTLLNKCHKFKSFVYQSVELVIHQGAEVLDIMVVPRKNGLAICSGCQKPTPGYDQLNIRRFEFIPIWGYRTFLLYQMRRVNCPTCGVKVEEVPWAQGKNELTKAYMQFLAFWARKMSWKEVAETFNTSWEKVFHSVEYIVDWGLKHRCLDKIKAIGIDEIAYQLGHKYLTVVYQIDRGYTRLLWIGEERTEKTIRSFFEFFTESRSKQLEFVCSDMWKPYVKVIGELAANKGHP
ncbi:transposase [Endozoicomonas sp.]|uniref:transposase n=1 Tax=Endozoicomonas sp. TaxID=1892382 RepID=UPI00383AC381